MTAHSGSSNDRLVVLVSDYPGWKLSIDGKPAKLTSVNYYLGANVLAGEHTYTFVSRPSLYRMGLIIIADFPSCFSIVNHLPGYAKKVTRLKVLGIRTFFHFTKVSVLYRGEHFYVEPAIEGGS